MTDHLFENVCLLLWEKEPAREKWPQRLGEWTGMPLERARKWLFSHDPNSDRLTGPELERLAQVGDLAGVEELQGRLLDQRGIVVWKQNLVYLANISLEHGQKKVLARRSGVTQSSLSKWLKGMHIPRREHQAKLCEFFGLPADIDLEQVPVFLSPVPAGLSEMRQFLKSRIDKVSDERLRTLFPALEDLLRET